MREGIAERIKEELELVPWRRVRRGGARSGLEVLGVGAAINLFFV